MRKGVRREPTLAELKKRLAWGLQGNLLPFSIEELKRQIAELEAKGA
jgi:hypothetical protein